MNQRQSQFPNHQSGLNYAFSDEPILLNGMKVIFDQSASVYPVSLESKNTIISTQLGNFQFSFAKTTIPIWAKIIRKTELEEIAGKRKTGWLHRKTNYDNIVDALGEFHGSNTLKGRLEKAGKVLESIDKYLQNPTVPPEYPKRIDALKALRNNIQKIVDIGKKELPRITLLKFMFNNEETSRLTIFRDFMEKEYSVENFDFLKDMTDYQKQKSTMTDTERLQRLNNIYNQYIRDTAPQQINIASEVRNAIETAIEQVKPFSPSDEKEKTEDGEQNQATNSRPRRNAFAYKTRANTVVDSIERAMNVAVEKIYNLVATDTFLRFNEKHSDLVQEIKMLTLSEKCEWDEYPKPQDDEKKE
ncbi:MAG: hypothetical protein GC195_04375 [Nostoc sp. RI_552]|nr:hypothetical protein [Nostoc sp. RI_552]